MRFFKGSVGAGVLVVLIGGGHLAAWLVGALARLGSSSITMKTNAALSLFLAGVALLIVLNSGDGTGKWWKWAARGAAGLTLAVGLLTLLEHIGGYNLGIDQILATEPPGALGVFSPNRMGLPAATCLILAGVGLQILSVGRQRGVWLVQVLALGVCGISMLGVIGYVYQVRGLYALERWTAIAWPMAVGLLLLGIGMLCARPERGLMAQVTAEDPGGVILRWLVVPTIVLVVVLGWLRLWGERRGLYEAPMGTGLLVGAFAIIFCGLTYWTAHMLSQAAKTEGETQRALRESEQRLRTLADNINQFAWMADERGWIFWYNKRWYDYTGTTFEEMQGWGWQKVHHPDQVERVTAKFRSYIEAGQVWEDVFPLRGKEGQYRWFLSRAMPIRDERGQVVRWFGTNTDITEQKQTEEELRRLKDELEVRVRERTAALDEANRELEAFGYSVSHDLRAPLRHINSYLTMLESEAGPTLNAESQQCVRVIAEATKRMGNLIDDLLVLSRLSRVAIEEQVVNLRQLVDQARHELAPDMEGRTIEWHLGSLPQVRGDPNLLHSAVVNLLSNAVKYTRRKHPAQIEVGSWEQNGELVCFVRDNGAGFDMRFVDKLFGVFQRLHRAQDFEGTGIGLASVRRVVQRHGGRTWAEGAVAKGAAFYFSLPASRLVRE